MANLDLTASVERLSEREISILKLLDAGLSDREIAARLIITLGTVKWYNRQIYAKLGVASRALAVRRAREVNLLETGGSTPVAARPPQPRHNLPAESTHFVGRRRELRAAHQLLREARLLTLTGSPGSGKTRLALRLAAEALDEFPQGVFFVNLAPLDNPAFVVLAIASALGLDELPRQPLIHTLAETLADQNLLLVLDNFEHLLPAATLVADLLQQAPALKVLVTSREPLHLHGEQEYPVAPLELPDAQASDLAALAECEAVSLFVQQARAVRPDFAVTEDNALDIAKICVRLDGLPLAIELAAAQSKLLNPRALLLRLAHPLATLVNGSRDLPGRHRTLQQTIDWSYNLLDPPEQTLFARLGVFAAGWTLEAMQAVCRDGLDLDLFAGLESLVNKSLVRQHEMTGNPRFEMLGTLRDYALEQLAASGEMESVRGQHARYYTELAEQVEGGLNGVDQRAALDSMELEHDNFRAVLGWAQAGNPEPGLRLIAALGLCWQIRGHMPEGDRWCQRLLDLGQRANAGVRARALSSASLLAYHMGDNPRSLVLSQESLGLARQTGQEATVAWALCAVSLALAQPPMSYDDYRQVYAYLDEALTTFRAQNSALGVAKCLTIKSELCRLQGRYDASADLCQEAADLFRELGNPAGICTSLLNLGWVSLRLGDPARAAACFRQSQQQARQVGYRSLLVSTLAGLAGVAALTHQPEQAARLFGLVEAQQEIYRDVLDGADRADYNFCMAAAQKELAPGEFQQLWADGRALSLDRAVVETG